MESALEAYVARRNAEAVAEAEKGMLYRLVRDGDLSAEKAARRLDVSEKQLLKDMQAADAAADPS